MSPHQLGNSEQRLEPSRYGLGIESPLVWSAVACVPFAGLGQPSEADEVREEWSQLKAEYEQRIQRLEEPFRRLEAVPGVSATNIAALPPVAGRS